MATLQHNIERFKNDFEFWCAECVKIKDKITGKIVPFILNAPQKKMLALMESQRLAGKPVRVILLKSRQWGGSTLVQIYIAWHQLILYKGRNAAIIGHKKNSSFVVKNMYRTLLKNYPPQYQEDSENPYQFVNLKDSTDVQELQGRDCHVILTSSYTPDGVRGYDLKFAHLTEVAFWQDAKNVDPSDLIRSVTGTVLKQEGTVVVLESTANGANSYFYEEWQRACEGKSTYAPLFVGWNEIEMYKLPLYENEKPEFSNYEKSLLERGFSVEQVNWYHEKMKEFPSHEAMMAEFPTTPEEAFISSTHYVFTENEKEQIKKFAIPPSFSLDNLLTWQAPSMSKMFKYNYIAMLTVGSVIGEEQETILSVWKHNYVDENHQLELVAQLNDKIPLNMIGSRVLPVCKQYDNALLVIANYNMSGKVFDRSLAQFVVTDDISRYRNLYIDSNKNKFININRDFYALMFYELIIAEKNALFVDHDLKSCSIIADLTIHNSQKIYTTHGSEMNFVINRAVLLYFWRTFNLKRVPIISEQEKSYLINEHRF